MSRNTYQRYKQENEEKTIQIQELIKTIEKLNNYIDMIEDKLIQKDKLINMISQSPLPNKLNEDILKTHINKWLEVKQKYLLNKNK